MKNTFSILILITFLFGCSEEQDRLIYISDVSGQSQIYEMILDDGRETTRLTDSPYTE